MNEQVAKNDVIRQLQKEVLSLQGNIIPTADQRWKTALGPIEKAFPNSTFPIGAVHEFISNTQENTAATNGFISGLLSGFMKKEGICLWVGTKRTIFPPALIAFGIQPERIIFIDVAKSKEVLWVIEEGLKCNTLIAVVGELQELSFTESRRLQLAVEESRVTGFIHRYKPKSENTVACVSRWKINPLRSIIEDGMPGVGAPRWNVQLAKVRNGKPGSWDVEWTANTFRFLTRTLAIPELETRKAG
ncbi:Error-prone repair protein ImuA [Flavipsychrobacter stenotrophus]|uniref:Error-prone repair protein ImuA n=1 Tax=Flavipsychrobacter stenotrophus TaxID=2077091 RepID=A0A2S7SSQ0_9BACT|nr:Error-prone repair protein ImuA [Flavipsychrobacter stenotrophus]PQJ09556.1 Error-prone repair protein ImuA [Flavipsychrobacter stenotrophus]